MNGRRNRPRQPRDFDWGGDFSNFDLDDQVQNMRQRGPWLLLGLIIIVLVFLLRGLPNFYTDWLWFQSLGQGQVFVTRITARLGMFALGFVVFFVLYMINVLIARRLAAVDARVSRYLLPVAALAGAGLAAFMGLLTLGQWSTVLRFLNAVPFNVQDPIFKQDVSFFVFTLPVYRFAQTWLSTAVILIAFAVALVFAMALGRFRLTSGMKAHLSALGALFLLLFAWNYRLDIFELVYSTRGVVTGVGYTDANALIPAYNILTVITIIAAIALLANVLVRAGKALAVTAGVWIVVTVLLAGVYPLIVQDFQVRPNEFVKEKPYIEYNIALTRQAFGIDTIREEDFSGIAPPAATDLTANLDTVQNIRLWDYRPLLDVYDQLQSIRPYYDFRDVDIDRYTVDGVYRQVMLSAREITQSRLPTNAQTWINQKLSYTHGYGVAMSPVNEITPDGSPTFLISNLPPQGKVAVDRPGIYFGEKMDGYVIVDTTTPEFDYPLLDRNATATYSGKDGVGVGSYIRRLLFALRFGDTNIMLSSSLKPESQVLMNRNVQDRIRLLAPFLILDQDPYIAILDGKLTWIQDAYTTTGRYPFSESYQGNFNYIRNSVKITVDAYDGNVTFYIVDENDPIVKAWQGIFAGLFTPMSEMPASLRAHIRYPEDLFRVQAEMFRTYHMQDANLFYTKEDQWAMPREIYDGKEQQMEPYYTIMKLPDGQREEFILLLPFTPNNKQNMVAWLGAKSDGENYGQRVLYHLPKDRLVFGPLQIEARISQDTEVSAQITLWSQRGSKVIRGNQLIIPIEKSFLYVEPLFLLAEQGQIPQLKRVIVSTVNSVAMDENLGLALRRLYPGIALPGVTPSQPTAGGQQPGAGQPVGPVTPGAPPTGQVADLIRQANDHYQKAQEALKAGDWTLYGQEQKALEAALRQLVQLAGTQ